MHGQPISPVVIGPPGQAAPGSRWVAALLAGFRDEAAALRTVPGREAYARACFPILLLVAAAWAAGTCASLRETGSSDWVACLWFDSQANLAVLVARIWVLAAPCVLLARFAQGGPANACSDPWQRHAAAVGRAAALQMPALLFAAAACSLGAQPAALAAPLVAGVMMALSAGAAAVCLGDLGFTERARGASLMGAGILLFAAASLGRDWAGAGAPSSRPLLPGILPPLLARAGLAYDLALNGAICFVCALLVAARRRSGALSARAVVEVVADVPHARERTAGMRLALGLALRRRRLRQLVPLLLPLPALALLIPYAPVLLWLATGPETGALAMLAGFVPTLSNPLRGSWEWHWSQSGGYSLLAAAAAWSALAGRFAAAPLAAAHTARRRHSGDLQSMVLSRLSSIEALVWLCAPAVLPIAVLAALASLCALPPAFRDGVPAPLILVMALAGPAHAVAAGLLGVAMGLRARIPANAAPTAALFAGVLLPVALWLLVRLTLAGAGRLDPPTAYLHSIAAAYRVYLASSLTMGAAAAWLILRVVRAPEE